MSKCGDDASVRKNNSRERTILPVKTVDVHPPANAARYSPIFIGNAFTLNDYYFTPRMHTGRIYA